MSSQPLSSGEEKEEGVVPNVDPASANAATQGPDSPALPAGGRAEVAEAARALREYAGDWRTRAADRSPVLKAAALLESFLAPAWRPIDTAPKDGTSVLVARADNGAVFSAYWQEDGGNGPGWADGSTDNYEDLRVYEGLTHWMPLPEPPPADGAPASLSSNEQDRPTSASWQSIESAPKDGAWVLLLGAEQRALICGPQAIGSYSDGYWADTHGYTLKATHWQPLPPLPEGGEKR